MASERQLAANRRNGRNGGPKTEAGKQRSRLNSWRHGLTSSSLVVLPEENQHEYDEVLRGFRESFQPHDAAEDALVLRLAQAQWRSLRSRRVETGILNTTAAVQRAEARKLVEDCPEHLNPHNAIAVGFMTMPPERWQMYLRYDTTISRDFFRTLDSLMKLQRMRQTRAPALAMAVGEAVSPVQSTFTAPSDSGIRSVSQDSSCTPNLNKVKNRSMAVGQTVSSAGSSFRNERRASARKNRSLHRSQRSRKRAARMKKRYSLSPVPLSVFYPARSVLTLKTGQ